ncbi:hypothetical protein [Leptothoe kymatousa]|uniref:Uncharacterized protein n=1 Tax=Leptothoe kymatousa TAU-MAC 1615 TaxID=2364775 RepID=A0ABS5Y4F7_9CYAN|nr:hypothetical protein [Leptothoe kymatousa]MBT9312724.1 hypothetical protein [Leptothoe kymatousa TAU-MAC 1615]
MAKRSQALFIDLFILLGVLLHGAPSQAQLPALPPVTPPIPEAVPAPPEEIEPEPVPEPSEPISSPTVPAFIRSQRACPQDFETVSTLLVRDIPSYANRIIQSTVADIATAYRPAYVITANQPERAPLDINERVYTTSPHSGQTLRQLFFTTLERQYSGLDATAINHFHWLFLAPSETGWQMVFMFSAIGDGDNTLLPPRDSSQGSVGQAVQRWLIDCRANAISVE